MKWWETYKAQTPDGIHLVIERRDNEPVAANWDVLQEIKNDMLGEDAYAIEIYPAKQNVVNEVNRRHFWLIPEDMIEKFDMSKR